jgi:hypothetical protein
VRVPTTSKRDSRPPATAPVLKGLRRTRCATPVDLLDRAAHLGNPDCVEVKGHRCWRA